jgi:precorrin-6B methylase 2
VAAINDRSVDSPEWAQAIVDWPSEYHFSRLRSNLLAPLPIRGGDRVVELGAGCGAITRWLGERGAQVIAVEGSEARAAIAAERCRDLANVHVVAQNLHEFPSFDADWVALIGVLEYSRVFHQCEDPVSATLIAARNQLATGGALVVAIENQLGLKYFAGCLEDHLGKPFAGIQNLYRDDGPVTFGRQELSDRLAAAGLGARRFLLPWPDYKLPAVVVAEHAADDPHFSVADLVARHMARDYHGPELRAFLEPLVWSTLERNGLIPDLANSFLVIAAADDSALAERSPDPSTLAWAYSNHNRRAHLNVSTRFVREGGKLRVRKETVLPPREPETGRWQHVIETAVDYHVGETLSIRMLRSIGVEDEKAFFEAGLVWIDLLLSKSCLHDSCRAYAAASWFTDGKALDLNPTNIVVGASGELLVFDQEWSCTGSVPFVWLVLRGLLTLPPNAVHGSLFRLRSLFDIARQLLLGRGLHLEQSDLKTAVDCEAEFQSWVTGIPADQVRWDEELITAPGKFIWPSVFEHIKTLERLTAASQHEREHAIQEREHAIQEREHAIREREHAIQTANAATEELRRAEAEFQRVRVLCEEDLSRARDEAHHLQLVCADLRTALEKYERHPIIGPAIRGRRRLRNVLRSTRSRMGL